MTQKTIAGIGLISAALFIAVLLMANTGGSQELIPPGGNVSVENGVQIIEIGAKGGYSPAVTTAKAGIPTIIRFTTKGTFDCSSFVRIPSLSITRNLPQSGATDIDIGEAKLGTLKGSCGMGMYPFEIQFES